MGRIGNRMLIVSALTLVSVLWAAEPARAAGQAESGANVSAGSVELEGELDVLYEDNDTGGRLRHFLIASGKRIPLDFQSGPAPDLPTGARVRVTGRMRNGGNIAEVITPTSVTLIGDTASRAGGAANALVILFTFSNDTRRYPPAAATAVTDDVRMRLKNPLSHTIALTVAGWFTIPATGAACEYPAWATQAEAAASSAGYNIATYDRRIFAFPNASSCTSPAMGNDARLQSWVNGTYGLRVVADATPR